MSFDYSKIDLPALLKRAYDQMDDIQRDGVGKGRARGRIFFNMHMGTGKGFTALTTGFCFKPQTWLVIGSVGALNAIRNELIRWYPEIVEAGGGIDNIYRIIEGHAWERQAQYQQSSLFYATTMGAFLRDVKWLETKKRVVFDNILMDEPQKYGIRNRKSEGFKAIKTLVKLIERHQKVKCIAFTSGTWTSKGSFQQWPALNILAPHIFKSYWKFVSTYNIIVNDGFGKVIAGPQNTEGLAIVTSPYVYTVTEEEAKKSLPPLRRIPLWTTLPQNIRDLYTTMESELYLVLDSGEVVSTGSLLGAYTKCRQLLCCPAIIDASLGHGPIIEAIADKIEEANPSESAEDAGAGGSPTYRNNWLHNIIFSPFLPALPVFENYLRNRWAKYKPNIIIMQGGMSVKEIKECEDIFRADPKSVVLCSTMFAQAFNLETTKNVYHAHFSWDQDDNKQAEARSRRKDGTQEFIGSYYGRIQGTITEDMFHLLNIKEHMNKVTYQDVMKLKEKLRARLATPNN